jgi:hypothetical protein
MSFPFFQKPISPLKMALGEFAFPSVLPHDVEALKALILAQQKAHATTVQAMHQAMHQEAAAIRQDAHDYVIRMLEQAVLARQRMFGASSEQLSAQSRLFDEAEALAQTSTEAQDVAPIAAAASAPAPDTHKPDVKPGRGKRAPLAAGLPRVDVLHDVPEADRTCACGTPMVDIGEDVSEQLDIVPMQVRVLRHIRKRYGCATKQHAPVTAALPAQPLPKSNASADFLAMLLAVKFVDGMPPGAL